MLSNRDSALANAIPLEMQAIMRHAAEPCMPGDSIKAQINRAARALGLNYRRARTFWYGSTNTIRADEADTLRQWYRQWIAGRKARLETEIQSLELEWQKMGPARETIILAMDGEDGGTARNALARPVA